MGFPVALVFFAALHATIGYWPARGRLDAWISGQPVTMPTPAQVRFVWIGSLAAFGAAVTWAGIHQERIIFVALLVPIAAAFWVAMLVRRDAPRNAFFFLCVAWTMIAIISAWVYALNAKAALLAVPLLVVLILGGTANFFIWQRPNAD